MLLCMKKLHRLKVRRYAERLIGLNKNLASFLGFTIADKIGISELNEINLNNSNKYYNMKNFLYKKLCGMDKNPSHI